MKQISRWLSKISIFSFVITIFLFLFAVPIKADGEQYFALGAKDVPSGVIGVNSVVVLPSSWDISHADANYVTGEVGICNTLGVITPCDQKIETGFVSFRSDPPGRPYQYVRWGNRYNTVLADAQNPLLWSNLYRMQIRYNSSTSSWKVYRAHCSNPYSCDPLQEIPKLEIPYSWVGFNLGIRVFAGAEGDAFSPFGSPLSDFPSCETQIKIAAEHYELGYQSPNLTWTNWDHDPGLIFTVNANYRAFKIWTYHLYARGPYCAFDTK